MPGSPNPVRDRLFIPSNRVPKGSPALAAQIAEGDAAIRRARKPKKLKVYPGVKFGKPGR